MRVHCPNCQASYDIDTAKIPEQGRHGRCTVCGKRFFISPPSTPGPPAAKAAPPSPAPKPDPQKRRPLRDTDWMESKYSKIHKYLLKYYAEKDRTYRYHITVFCFAHRELPSTDYIRNEISRLKSLLVENQARRSSTGPNPTEIEILESENLRYRTMIQIFKDLAEARSHFSKKGLTVTFNELFTVLRDVDLAFLK